MMRTQRIFVKVFNELKDAKINQVTEFNAVQFHELAKKALLYDLQNLNPKDIIDVRSLYVDFAILAHTASYLAAHEKAAINESSFAQALNTVSPEEVLKVLKETFIKEPDVEKLLNKFTQIDAQSKPFKDTWAELHSKVDSLATFFNAHPVPVTEDLDQKKRAVFLDISTLYQSNLEALEKKIFNPPPNQNDQERFLFDKAETILSIVKTLKKKKFPYYMGINDLLICANAILDKPNDKNNTIKNVQNLMDIVQGISDRSPLKKDILLDAITVFCCAALVTVGILIFVPTFGLSLLFAVPGALVLYKSSQQLITDAISLYTQKDLAKFTSEFRNELVDLKNKDDDIEAPVTPVETTQLKT